MPSKAKITDPTAPWWWAAVQLISQLPPTHMHRDAQTPIRAWASSFFCCFFFKSKQYFSVLFLLLFTEGQGAQEFFVCLFLNGNFFITPGSQLASNSRLYRTVESNSFLFYY